MHYIRLHYVGLHCLDRLYLWHPAVKSDVALWPLLSCLAKFSACVCVWEFAIVPYSEIYIVPLQEDSVKVRRYISLKVECMLCTHVLACMMFWRRLACWSLTFGSYSYQGKKVTDFLLACTPTKFSCEMSIMVVLHYWTAWGKRDGWPHPLVY